MCLWPEYRIFRRKKILILFWLRIFLLWNVRGLNFFSKCASIKVLLFVIVTVVLSWVSALKKYSLEKKYYLYNLLYFSYIYILYILLRQLNTFSHIFSWYIFHYIYIYLYVHTKIRRNIIYLLWNWNIIFYSWLSKAILLVTCILIFIFIFYSRISVIFSIYVFFF